MQPTDPPVKTEPDRPSPLKRRGLLLGAGAAGAAVAVGVIAVRSPGVAPEAAPGPQARADDGAGYRLTEHVRRYYETART